MSDADPDELDARLARVSALRELGPNSRAQLARIGRLVSLVRGQVLIEQGAPGDCFYFLLDGEIEILVADHTAGFQHQTARRGAGEPVGEMCLLDEAPRSATVRATCPTHALRISIDDFRDLAATDKSFLVVERQMVRTMVARMRELGERTAAALSAEVAEHKLRKGISNVLIATILVLCVFAFAMIPLRGMMERAPADFFVTTIILLPLTVGVLLGLRRSEVPLAEFGLTMQGWKRSLGESLVISCGVIVGVTLIKLVLIQTVPAFADTPLFDWYAEISRSGQTMINPRADWWIALAIYVVEVPLQELLARGVLQSSLQRLLTFEARRPMAIVLASVIFGTIHLYGPTLNALGAMSSGLFFGWLYSRHETLLGVTVSHALIGTWGMFFLGLIRTY